MKNVYCVSTKQHEGIKSGVSQSKNSTISQALIVFWCTVLLEGVKVNLSPRVCETDHFGRFVAATVKIHEFVISKPDKVHHRNRTAIQQLSTPVVTSPCLYSRHIRPI